FLQAIAHSVDAQSMIANTYFGHGERATSAISPENKVFYDPNLEPYAYDLEKARALLTEGGYVDRDGDGVREDRNGNARELDLEKRKQHYWRIQEILHRELPLIQLVRQEQFVAYKSYLENFVLTPWGLYQPERIAIRP